MAILTRTASLFRPQQRIDQSALTENRKLIEDIDRRGLLRGAVSLGALTMLTGCDVSEINTVQKGLRAVSAWNDRVQQTIFRSQHLAPTFTAAQVRKPRGLTPITRFRMSSRLTAQLGPWNWPAASKTSGRGPRSGSTRCPNRRSSSGTFASKAGIISANGPGRTCANSCSASAPI